MKKKHPSPSDLSTRLLRANVDTYLVVKGLSRRLHIPMADALDKLILGKIPKALPEPVAVTTKPAFRVTAPVALPVTAPVALRHRLSSVITTNGNKAVAFRIKPKGVSHD